MVFVIRKVPSRALGILSAILGFSQPWTAASAIEAPPLSVQQIYAMRSLPEPLVPLGGVATAAENNRLSKALAAFEARAKSDDFSALQQFISAFPASPWRFAVQANLGILYYHAGYFSKCLPTYLAAWEAGKNATDPKAKALADRAAGEYTKMLARLGRYEELKAFLKGVEGREFAGQATELMTAGKEGAMMMEKTPEMSFRCGPMALSRILHSQGSPLWASDAIVNSKSAMGGISLSDVARLSATLGMNYLAARRSPGAPLIIPSVIHWKVGHYAALIRKVGGKYLTEDPTFENETWHSAEALDEEASGYYLVPPGPLPQGWLAVNDEQASKIFGKGTTLVRNPYNTTPCDPQSGGTQGQSCGPPPTASGSCSDAGQGMAVYSFHNMLASLRITDTPVGYTPPYGSPIFFTVSYTQREASQPSNFNYSNLGAKWNFDWLTYITDDPNNPASASQGLPGGGSIAYAGYSAGKFAPQFDTNKQLSNSGGGLPYTIANADGSQEIYGQSDGSTVAPRKIFLTKMIDPSGNATTLAYDNQHRITTITDAVGRQTTLSYALAGDPYKITQVTDPFGRSATFSYDGSGRLVTIQDVIGIQSTFTYNGTGDFINSLTTPYGTTTFSSIDDGLLRRLTATDPAGDTEVIESNNLITNSIAFSEPSAPQGLTNASQYNQYLYYRNSFFWNKKQWKEFPNNHSMAHIYHWLHDQNFTQMSGYLESEKDPLQSRNWYSYPGQSQYIAVGSQTTRNGTGRVVEGGSQLTFQSVNAIGFPTSKTDPLGRTTNYQYASNNMDLLSVQQVIQGTPATTVTLESYTWDAQHHPQTHTDAAGQTTTFTYNAHGQITSVTDPLGGATTYTYYAGDAAGHQRNGRLYQVDGPLPGNSDVTTYEYDAFGRIANVTGPDGYYLSYAYDALDRLTQITYPDGTSTQTAYNALDRQATTDRLGRSTTYAYNSLRQLIFITDPANRTIQYRWCRCGAMSQLIDAMGRTTLWKHDAASRPISKQYADGSTITYAYAPLSGMLQSTTDEKAQVKTQSYNLDNSLASTTYTNAQISTPAVSYAYDASFARMTSMTDGTGTTSYAYFPIAAGTLGAGKLSTETSPIPNSAITYSYDALGRQIGYAINGVGETKTLDAMGRRKSLVNPLGSFGYSYDGATQRLTSITYPSGMNATYDYQPLIGDYRLKDIVNTLPGNSFLSQHSYVYDAVGNITRWTQISPQAGINRSWLCGYDTIDQLTSVSSQDPSTFANQPSGQYVYSYDAARNRLSESIDGVNTNNTYSALNQLGALSGTGSSMPAEQTYEWDAENRLTAIHYTGNTKISAFQYDGRGRRVRVTETQGATGISDSRYVWLGFRIMEQRDSSGQNVQSRYYDRGMQVAVAGGILATRFFTADHLSSVREVLSMSNSLQTVFDFDPWGRRSIAFGTAEDATLGFTSHWHHAASGLVAAPFRFYSPGEGRWLSRDPLGELVGTNLYSYVNNAPIDSTDPYGLFDFSPNNIGPGLGLGLGTAYLAGGVAIGWTTLGGAVLICAGGPLALLSAIAIVGQVYHK